MDAASENRSGTNHSRGLVYLIGAMLIGSGLVILVEGYLRTGWLVLLILPVISLSFIARGIWRHELGSLIAGGILAGIGFGILAALKGFTDFLIIRRIGVFILIFAAGWSLITILTGLFSKKLAWWALIPGGLIGALGACFYFSSLRLVDFVLYMLTALGVIFLATGVYTRLFGLIIPGCLLIGIGPGIYAAWGGTGPDINGLTQTGVMLVCFALSWGLITLFSRVITVRFIWWPLIPAGILAMVGWGLYIGGDPGNALSFIGNTGSIGLIIFGLYLLLWRKGIRK